MRLEFEPYSYGPFSRQVMETASELERSGEIIIDRTDYKTDQKFEDSLQQGEKIEINNYLDKFSEQLKHDFSFDNLELHGTVLYCIQALQEIDLEVSRDSVLREVQNWKGTKYSKDKIVAAYEALYSEFVQSIGN